MSFIGYWSAPVSIPRVFDTTPCLQHMLEYEDCVGDVQSIKTEYLMPSWPTLWPQMQNGTTNRKIDGRGGELQLFPGDRPVADNDFQGLNSRQKQLLYQCEEERMVYKACLRQLIKLKRNGKMKSWDTAEISNVYLV